MKGIGVDICKVARVEEALEKHGARFLARVLTAQELAAKDWTPAALARRWALKEAVAKAFGSGIGAAIGFHDIEVAYTDKGQPQCRVRGFEDCTVWVSTSDDTDYAVAMAAVETATK